MAQKRHEKINSSHPTTAAKKYSAGRHRARTWVRDGCRWALQKSLLGRECRRKSSDRITGPVPNAARRNLRCSNEDQNESAGRSTRLIDTAEFRARLPDT